MSKPKIRRQSVREQRVRAAGTQRALWFSRVFSWRVLSGLVFLLGTCGIVLLGVSAMPFSIGQRVDRPVYARVTFAVPDDKKTEADRDASRAKTPSYFAPTDPALTTGRIRADLTRLYQAAVDSDTFEAFKGVLKETNWTIEERAYTRLRELSSDAGRATFKKAVDELPLEQEYVTRDVALEPREPRSSTEFIRLEVPMPEGPAREIDIKYADLVPQGNDRILRGSAQEVARKLDLPEGTVASIVLAVFREHPTIVYNREKTEAEMRKAEEATPVAMKTHEAGKPFLHPGLVGSSEFSLLRAEHDAYHSFVSLDTREGRAERKALILQRTGVLTLVLLLAAGLLVYAAWHQPWIFEARARTTAFLLLLLGTLGAVQAIHTRWPDIPELSYAPGFVSVLVLAIVYPRRLAIGTMFLAAVIMAAGSHEDLSYLIPLLIGTAILGQQLREIRTRTKLPMVGVISALSVGLAITAAGMMERNAPLYIWQHALWGGACALAAALVVSGTLPFIERVFRVTTSLTLLEWRDPTRPVLQLLAREAPGTYNHSLVVGTLADKACEAIGADGLLAQVGALYHDIGKITKPGYFAENQEGRISRHEHLAPTMSLLIILGHVKDGIEMAKEYKLPRALHEFIAEHHGTTVVRYFHHMAIEKQGHHALGRHDREVPEAEFRYAGPKPRTRESAVVMLADGVEGVVRSLPEPTPGRIEGNVHGVVMDRLNDGQFDDCDITLKELRAVEQSLVKTLCAIYHGRVAYPKTRKPSTESMMPPIPERISV